MTGFGAYDTPRSAVSRDVHWAVCVLVIAAQLAFFWWLA